MRIAVIGLGRFGLALARQLLTSSHVHLVAVEKRRELVDFLNHETNWVQWFDDWEVTDLEEIGIDSKLDVAVVAIGESGEETQRWVVTFLDLGIPRILARAQDDVQAAVMERLLRARGGGEGHAVIRPEHEAAQRLGKRLLLPRLDEILEIRNSAHSVATLTVPVWAEGKTIMEAGVRRDYQLNVLRVRRAWDPATGGERVEVIPVGPDTALAKGDEITVLGLPERIQDFLQGP